MPVQWFPGHMARAVRALKTDLKLADLLLLVCDARVPRASLPSNIEEIAPGKKTIFILNKADLAEDNLTDRWLRQFKTEFRPALAMSSVDKKGIGRLRGALYDFRASILAGRRKRGLKNDNLRLLIAGIPNVGKSTLTNLLAGTDRAQTGRKPGVTRGRQWLNAGMGLEIMDTPGILPPRISPPETGWLLLATGAVPDDIFSLEEAALPLIGILASRGRIKLPAGISPAGFLEESGRERGFFLRGGVVDLDKAAQNVLKSFREGKFGRLTLEEPPHQNP